MWQTALLLLLAASPVKEKPRRVETTLLAKKTGKEVIPAMAELGKPPTTGCWKQTEPLLFNILPASIDADGKPKGPWKVSPAPKNTSTRFSVSLVAGEPGGLTVQVTDTQVDAGMAPVKFFSASDAPLDLVEVSADGKVTLFYRSTIAGDLARYLVSVKRPGPDPATLISPKPIAFVSLSPDSRQALIEGGELVDLAKGTSTPLENLPEGYLQPIAWSCDGTQLVVVATENWVEPAWAAKWRITLPRPTGR